MLYIVPPSSHQPIFWVRAILCLPSPHSIQAQHIKLESRSILQYSIRSLEVLFLITSIILRQTQQSTMSVVLFFQDCAKTGEYVCFYIFHRNLVEQSIGEGHHVAVSLHGNSTHPQSYQKGVLLSFCKFDLGAIWCWY
jgi:hypothetical protein